MINFCDLSPEIVLYIFQYCNVYDLCRLRQCCKRFNEIILLNKLPLQEINALVTNQVQKCIRDRSISLLEPYEKWRISHNWKIGRFKRAQYFQEQIMYMPWILLDSTFLWLSRGRHVKAYLRKTNGTLQNVPKHIITGSSKEDVVRFQYKNDILISAIRDGNIWLWFNKQDQRLLEIPFAHVADVSCVDLTKDIFVSGAETLKIWPLNTDQNTPPNPLHVVDVEDYVLSTAISPSDTKIAIGSSALDNFPLHVFDLGSHQTHDVTVTCQRGSGILDMHWENENILLTCGYDTYLRKWDMRTETCVQRWMDPHNATVYCLASDDLFTVLCGTSYYGRVVLWDQRKLNYVQLYYTHKVSNSHRSSPVYSLSFDCCQLYAALDRSIVSFDFSVRQAQIINYSEVFTDYYD